MHRVVVSFLLTLILCCSLIAETKGLNENKSNQTPQPRDALTYHTVIGILSQPSGFLKYNNSTYSYIYTSYVQYFQQAGARIIPLKYTDSLASLKNKMKSINGLVIPGGGSNLMQRNSESGDKEFTKFAEVGKFLINLAKKMNYAGKYFPVWGTCLGFELLVLTFTKSEVRDQFQGENHLGGFQLSPSNALKSRLFKNISTSLSQKITNQQEIFYFNHKYGFKINKFLTHEVLKNHFIPVAYSQDLSGKKFVSIAEATKYPFYGIQFHPEKLQFEWSPYSSKQLKTDEIEIVQYFANFFYSECTKSTQQFENNKILTDLLIENYQLNYLKGYEQGIYFFNNEGRDQFKYSIENNNQYGVFLEEEKVDFNPQLNEQKLIEQQIGDSQEELEEKQNEKIIFNLEDAKNKQYKQNHQNENELGEQSQQLLKILKFLLCSLIIIILLYLLYEKHHNSKNSKSVYSHYKNDEEHHSLNMTESKKE